MKGVESYMHRYAKQVVGSWLRNRSRVGVNFKGLQPILQHLPLMDKSTSPMFGVYEEFPVAHECDTNAWVGVGGDLKLEDSFETDWHRWCAQEPLAHSVPRPTTVKRTGIPMLKELTKPEWKAAVTVDWMFDVGVVDPSGVLCYVVEICHKNPMSDAKIAWLTEHNIGWCELGAEWVMSRVKPPFNLNDGIMRKSE